MPPYFNGCTGTAHRTANSSRNRTFTACSAGLLPPPSSHALSFLMGSSCFVAGPSTNTVSLVAGPGSVSISPHRRNCATPRAAAS